MLPALANMKFNLNCSSQEYDDVPVELERAFSAYEAGQISIIGYLEAVAKLEKAVRRRRALLFWLCDWSVALSWLNRAERRAFREMAEALDWCRNWAMRQRGADTMSCLEIAGVSAPHAFGQPAGAGA